ncbi:MAG: cytochrome c biogenesis protein CcdA [Methanoregula sp.]|nr:cytochrome c biogenesis protein CcdA [Methanoregula sp.]
MEKTQKIFLVLLAVIIVSAAFFLAAPYSNSLTTATLPPTTVKTSETVTAFYFYGDGCSHCEKVKPLLTALETRYPELHLTRLELYNNVKNRQIFSEMSRKYGIANPGVPLIFIGNSALIGDVEITDRFEYEILLEKQRLLSCNGTAQSVTPVRDPSCTQESQLLSLPMVIFAAIVDSANPCGLSVLVFLLIQMAAAGSRRRILLAGGAYITAMFLFHLLVGIGLFSVISFSGLSRTFALIGGAVALLLGIITIADVLRNKETFILSIPESKKGMLGTYIRIASLPAAFVLGILAGILGFSCTGGIYISILGLMGREMTVMSGLPWLVLYNLVYVLPLILITILVAYGISPERADRMRSEYKRTLRLVIGVILVALGAVILLGWMG